MFRLIVVSFALAACSAQNVLPKNAKILKEQRFNAGDGRAGAAFATEDGTVFKEETDVDGNRIGQYSYIGENGKTFTVRYSAGKDGFRILSGDHIRATGQEAAQFDENFAEPQQLAQEALPAPRPQTRVVQQQQPQQVPLQPRLPLEQAPLPLPIEEPVDPNRNPFVNPHDPTHRDFQFNSNARTFDPSNPNSRQASLVPDCADCAGVNPFINPFDSTHQQAGLLAGHLAGHRAAPAPRPIASLPRPQAPIPRPQPVQQQRVFAAPTTQAPRNFFPPGQLSLNRFETGFNFDFSS